MRWKKVILGEIVGKRVTKVEMGSNRVKWVEKEWFRMELFEIWVKWDSIGWNGLE